MIIYCQVFGWPLKWDETINVALHTKRLDNPDVMFEVFFIMPIVNYNAN